jgi:hypothetical protein
MTEKSLSDELRKRAIRALFSFAIFRWESAVTLAVTLILAVFAPQPLPFWQWWFWLVLGVIAEVLIVVTSIYDPQVRERVVGEMFREKFDPKEIANPDYRQRVVKAWNTGNRWRYWCSARGMARCAFTSRRPSTTFQTGSATCLAWPAS